MTSVTRVMIIEDDLNIAQLHQRYLEQMEGYEVIGIATTKVEAEISLMCLAQISCYLMCIFGWNRIGAFAGTACP